MRITKLEHSGLVLDKNGQKLVFDPVEFTETVPELDNVVAIVVTHGHGDHLQPEILSAIVDRNPNVKFLVPLDVEVDLVDSGQVEKVSAGVERVIGDFTLRFFGNDHAEIVPGKVPCRNLGVVVDDLLVNPGDSFDVPEMSGRVKVLCVPSAAPWCKVTEGMAYIEKVKPEIVIPVHNAVLSDLGNKFNNNWLGMACETNGSKLAPLVIGESIEY